MLNRLISVSKFLFTSIFILSLCSSCTKDDSVEWHMVDVNFYRGLQGDAHLILDAGHVALVDAGYGGVIGDGLTRYLQDLGITRIDKFIISHPHRDHYEGIRNIVAAGIKVDAVYYNHNVSVRDCCYKEEDFLEVLTILTAQGAKIHDVHEGQDITLGRTSFNVLLAAKSNTLDGRNIDLNDASIVMKWQVFNHRVLFAGDLNDASGEYLNNNRSQDIKADILKVPHHGATGIAPIEFFETVSPQLLMFPDPDWVRTSPRGEIAFGYASRSAVKECSNSLNGTVKLTFKLDAVFSEPSKPSEKCASGIIVTKS